MTRGVCKVLSRNDDDFRLKWVQYSIHSEELLPTLYSLKTTAVVNAYWFNDDEERVEALKQAIVNLKLRLDEKSTERVSLV
jgi:hypothetical protein